MESRKITFARGGRNITINSEAETLSQLKADMRKNNIEYNSNNRFIVGIVKTELIGDSSKLPTNIPYKGAITNNLVIMITVRDKKVSNGASNAEARRKAYNTIKQLGLKDKIKNHFGKNFTTVKTVDLVSFLENLDGSKTKKPVKKEKPVAKQMTKKEFVNKVSEKTKTIIPSKDTKIVNNNLEMVSKKLDIVTNCLIKTLNFLGGEGYTDDTMPIIDILQSVQTAESMEELNSNIIDIDLDANSIINDLQDAL